MFGRPCRANWTNTPPKSSPRSRSPADVSGSSRKASSTSRETFPSRSKSWFGRPTTHPLPTCSSSGSSTRLPGSRSRACSSSLGRTRRCIRIFSVFRRNALTRQRSRPTAATSSCFPSLTLSSTSFARPLPRFRRVGQTSDMSFAKGCRLQSGVSFPFA